MKITDQKLDSFMQMLTKFAKTHGISVEFDYNTAQLDIMDIRFRSPKDRRSELYRVYWPDEYSLTEAAAPIMADVLSKWKLGDMQDRPKIEKVIFNAPATIVLWSDNTKTVVKCQEDDIYDPEKGLAMAISKKYLGNKGNYCEVFKKWIPEEKKTALEEFNKILESIESAVVPKELIEEIFDGPGEPIRVREEK